MPSKTEELASKGMGIAKGVKARVEGLHGVFRHLAEEHGEVTVLLMRLKGSSDIEKRRDLFPKIRAELLGHEKAELRHVYPAFEENAELAPLAKRHDDEASELEQTLEELHAMAFDDAQWQTKFDRLVELVSEHVDEEEDEFFPAGDRVLGKARAEAILERYEETKKAITAEAERGAR
ncbi:MAG TPA: hemerythrin domain-containing protein [Labilithrix sp.]|jgi:hypothetical protein